MFLESLVAALVTSANTDVEKLDGEMLQGWALRALIYFLAAMGFAYLYLPEGSNPMWGWGLFVWPATLATFVGLGVTSHECGFGFLEASWRWGKIFFLVSLWLLVSFISGWEIAADKHLVSLIGEVKSHDWEKTLSPIKPEHIPMVAYEQAEFRGGTTLSQAKDMGVGSRFQIGYYAKQRVGERLEFVAPLEWLDWWKFDEKSAAPAFVRVSAENAQAEPMLVQEVNGKPVRMRYLPSAYFDLNLFRHLYRNGFSSYQLVDPTLELDDQGNPFYVVSLVVPTAGWSGRKCIGVVIVNPETGEFKRYKLSELPTWVDRAIPDDVAKDQVDWWGALQQGFWRGRVNGLDTLTPTTQNLIWGENGECFWYHEIRSASQGDRSRTGFLLMSSRTGKATFYRQHNGISMNAALASMAGAVANYPGYHPADAIQFNLEGKLAYIAPILTKAHVYELLAIVDSADPNSEVALGKTKEAALAEFRRIAAKGKGGNEVSVGVVKNESEIVGSLDAVNFDLVRGNKTWYLFTKANRDKIFIGSGELGPDLILAQKGDQVKIIFVDTPDRIVPIRRIENLALK